MKSFFVVEASDDDSDESDINPALKGGDLASLAAKPIAHLMCPIIDPIEARPHPKSASRRPRSGTAASATSWPWAGQSDVVGGHHVSDIGRGRISSGPMRVA